MASIPALLPSRALPERLRARGAANLSRCFQCATCSAVCDLAPADAPFPRRIVHNAQWGLEERLVSDPAVWLCHQCNDCTQRCPRDVRPGDVVAAVRGFVIEKLAFPPVLGRMVGSVRTTWPLLLGLPILFWVLLLGLTGHLAVPADLPQGWAYEHLVPHAFLYAVFFPVAAFVLLAAWVSGRRFWQALGGAAGGARFLPALATTALEIGSHVRLAKCETARPRRWGHLALLWGFVGAAVTSGLLIVAIYVQQLPMPLPLDHPYKLLGNLSAVLLVVGGAVIVLGRLGDSKRTGAFVAFDGFFLTTVVLVIATGVAVEVVRLANLPAAAVPLYVVHLGVVTTLFLTFPYSKFAHMLYRSLAMVHERRARTEGA